LIAASDMKMWQPCGYAAVFTTIAYALFLVLKDPLKTTPPALIFVLPVIISAYLGGWRAGLLATALACSASFYLGPPLHGFHDVALLNVWQTLFLLITGVLVSTLNEASLHRARCATKAAYHLSEEVLQKAQNIQNAIFNCPNFSCIATDAKGIIQFFSTGAERMFGYKAVEVVSKLTPADLHDQQEVMARAKALSLEFDRAVAPGVEGVVFKAAQGIEDTYEVTKVRKDGSRFAATVSVTALRDSAGEIIGYLLVGTDNTARRQMEAEQERSRQQLEQSNMELAAAKALAEKANKAKSEFLSNVSHELRTPLNAILGFAQLMESGTPPAPAFQAKCVNQILHGGWYLLKLINEILDLAAIESGKLSLSKESILLADVLATCRNMMEPQAQQRGIQMTFASMDRPVYVLADHTRLKQILINLLSNALKYNKDSGSVVVDCVERGRDRIRINVRDTGLGLPPEKTAMLFTPFNRLGHEGGSIEGTGIGLVMSKRLAEMMDGVLGVESAVGKGSVFWCELMVADPPLHATRNTEVETAMTAHFSSDLYKRTVLYVEDNPANMELVEEVVAPFPDLKLVKAVNATIGIEMARATQPQVILMDINLPGISGLRALEILREHPTTYRTPVIALSANAMPREIEKALEAGFFKYLTKPIKIKELTETLRAALNLVESQSGSGEANGRMS
jgi:signal transduction histidine kinase/ActR/RegA family two-component response regulator